MEFTATIEAGDGGGAFVRLPPGAAEVFGTRARVPVNATFSGIPYRGSTMPAGDGTFRLGITKAVRASAGLAIGDAVEVAVERDEAERTVEVPGDLAAAFAAQPAAAVRFGALSHSQRRAWVDRVTQARRPATRRRRVAEVVEQVAAGGTP